MLARRRLLIWFGCCWFVGLAPLIGCSDSAPEVKPNVTAPPPQDSGMDKQAVKSRIPKLDERVKGG